MQILKVVDVLLVSSSEFIVGFGILLCLVSIALSAIMSAAEVSFFSFTSQTFNLITESAHKRDQRIKQLLQNPQKLLATIIILNHFANISFVVAAIHLFGHLSNEVGWAFYVWMIVAIVVLLILLLVGEIFPKLIASRYNLKVAYIATPYIRFFGFIFTPLVQLLYQSTESLNQQLTKNQQKNITLDELSHALELTANKSDEDMEILEGIIQLGNFQVVHIMTPRTEIVDANIQLSYDHLLQLVIASGYSRIPVYEGTRDQIKGVLYVKDLLPHIDKPASFRWQMLLRQPYFVPENQKIDKLLREFQKNKVHLAIVVDEYGGTSGLITLEDIIEEIVGEISDEFDEEEHWYTQVNENTYVFEAQMTLNDFLKIEGIDAAYFESIKGDVETLAGLILKLKGEMPHKNERIIYRHFEFEILSVDSRRIKKLKLTIHKV